ncbi:hypothetical protein GCM10009687_22780 [Asanoa iriomotensis]
MHDLAAVFCGVPGVGGAGVVGWFVPGVGWGCDRVGWFVPGVGWGCGGVRWLVPHVRWGRGGSGG